MGKPVYKCFRVDPHNKRVGVLNLSTETQNYALMMQRFCRAGQLGHQKLCDVDGEPLMVAADALADDTTPGFRMKGSEKRTAGLAVLFGTGEKGGFAGAPVDKQWIDRHIVWLTADETCEDEEE